MPAAGAYGAGRRAPPEAETAEGPGAAGSWALRQGLPSAWSHPGRVSPGYYGEGLNAIIVFAACFLPDSSSPDYHYIMEHLFL